MADDTTNTESWALPTFDELPDRFNSSNDTQIAPNRATANANSDDMMYSLAPEFHEFDGLDLFDDAFWAEQVMAGADVTTGLGDASTQQVPPPQLQSNAIMPFRPNATEQSASGYYEGSVVHDGSRDTPHGKRVAGSSYDASNARPSSQTNQDNGDAVMQRQQKRRPANSTISAATNKSHRTRSPADPVVKNPKRSRHSRQFEPLMVEHPETGQLVLLRCPDCHHGNFGNIHGFLLHRQMMHGENYTTHRKAVIKYGVPVSEAGFNLPSTPIVEHPPPNHNPSSHLRSSDSRNERSSGFHNGMAPLGFTGYSEVFQRNTSRDQQLGEQFGEQMPAPTPQFNFPGPSYLQGSAVSTTPLYTTYTADGNHGTTFGGFIGNDLNHPFATSDSAFDFNVLGLQNPGLPINYGMHMDVNSSMMAQGFDDVGPASFDVSGFTFPGEHIYDYPSNTVSTTEPHNYIFGDRNAREQPPTPVSTDQGVTNPSGLRAGTHRDHGGRGGRGSRGDRRTN